MSDLRSTKVITPQDRLIMALDVASFDEATHWVDKLGDAVSFYKLGLELFMSGDYYRLMDWLLAREKKIFVDLKFFDVPETVKKAVKQLNGRGATFATVHGNDAILRAAAEAKGEIKILGVTVLTSLDRGDLDDLGFACDVEQLVLSRARRALANGCDGVISSGLEVPKLRAEVDDKLIAITPGIRPVENRPQDDQKRTVDVAQAFRNGADYIVVGRPIRQATDPYQMAQQIQRTIRDVFTPRV